MPSRDIELNGRPMANVGFITQGQVDWVAFGNTVFSASLAVMQRLAGAGIQPTTHCGGLALASQFRLGPLGLRRIETALQKLSSVPLFDSIMYVGFGIQSFVKTLVESQIGVNLAALCGCLAATHSEPMSARILAALWDLEGFPTTYKPSHAQFLQLVKNCAGICHTTTFCSTVDVMLGGRTSRQRSGHEDPSSPIHASIPEEIARALTGLFEISNDKTAQIKVMGGASCGFIAALAVWLFNLQTDVHEQDGTLIFTSTDYQSTPQVLVEYVVAHEQHELQIGSKTYILGPNDEIIHVDDSESQMMRLSIRTPWDGCLERSFGPIVNDCLNHYSQLGEFLGSVARVYAALANSELEVGGFSRRNFIDFSPNAYGLGFIQNVSRVLPELAQVKNLKGYMMNSNILSVKDAVGSVEKSIFALKDFCKCCICKEDDTYDQTSFQYCLPTMALTIRQLVSVLTSVVNELGIEPTVSGLEEVYMKQQYLWYQSILSFEAQGREHMTAAILGLDIDEPQIPSPSYERMSPAMLTEEVETIFLGIRPSNDEVDRLYNRVALSKFGVCIYLQSLRGISCRPEMMRQIHLIPGYISHKDRRYERVFDVISKETTISYLLKQKDLETISYEVTRSDSFQNVALQPVGLVKMHAFVVEPFDGESIRFCYRASVPSGSVDINPGLFTERVLLNAGLLHCHSQHRLKTQTGKDLSLESAMITRGWALGEDTASRLPHTFQIASCIWRLSNDENARCLAFEYQNQHFYAPTSEQEDSGLDYYRKRRGRAIPIPNRHVRVFLRQQQCLHCCTSILARTHGGVLDLRAEDKVIAHIV